MCVLNGLVSLRFTEGPRGRIRAVSLGPYVAGVGSERCRRGLVLSALRPESRPRDKCVWYQ